MADKFDPYIEWLGIRETSRPLSHYQLLGLADFEQDPLAIAVGADAAAARIKSCNPMGRGARWQQLLDEVSLARLCLVDRARKLQYDEQLRARLGTGAGDTTTKSLTATPHVEVTTPRASRPSAPVNPDLFPPNYLPAEAPTITKAAKPTAAAETVPIATPIEASPQEFAMPPVKQVIPKAIPVARAAGGTVLRASVAARNTGSVPTDEPADDVPIFEFASGSTDPSTILPGSRSKTSNPWMLVGVLIVVCMTILVASAAAFVFWQRGPNASTQVSQNTTNSIPHAEQPPSIEPPANPFTENSKPSDIPPQQVPAPPERPNTDAPPEAAPSVTTTEPAVTERPPSVPPTPAPTEPEQTAEQKAAFEMAVKNAFAAMASRNLDVAKQHLESAKSNAGTKQQEEQLNGLVHLHGYTKGFWNAVGESLKSLQATDTLPLGNSPVAVVEVDANSITIRTAGRNLSYTLSDMPSGLAIALANHWFDEEVPSNKIYLGAFHAVDAKGDPQEARRLWQEAANAGADTTELLPFLEQRQSASRDNGPNLNP